tara:strand:+ start:1123 stop:1554 length:432 start_codon:yes stop_codon:yes gene_type:complete
MDNIVNIHNCSSPNKTVVVMNIESFNTQKDCNNIIDAIKDNYNCKKDFYLILETRDLKSDNISIKCLYIFSDFINSLKNNKYQYLKKTIIKIYDNYCYHLLYFLFTYLSSPIAIVEVILYDTDINKPSSLENIHKIKQYFPKN